MKSSVSLVFYILLAVCAVSARPQWAKEEHLRLQEALDMLDLRQKTQQVLIEALQEEVRQLRASAARADDQAVAQEEPR